MIAVGNAMRMSTDQLLALRVRTYLCAMAGQGTPITYQALSFALDLTPPHTIHQLTIALEGLIEEDAAAGHPLIAALVISRARGGLPAPGFFECARHVGRFDGDPSGAEARTFHAAERDAAFVFWSSVTGVMESDVRT